MRLRNPFYEDQVIAEAQGLRTSIEARLRAIKGQDFTTLEELKAAVPSLKNASPAAVNHALQTLGVTFEG